MLLANDLGISVDGGKEKMNINIDGTVIKDIFLNDKTLNDLFLSISYRYIVDLPTTSKEKVIICTEDDIVSIFHPTGTVTLSHYEYLLLCMELCRKTSDSFTKKRLIEKINSKITKTI